MDILRGLLELAAFAAGFIGVGVVVGVAIHHFGLGWFISRAKQDHLEDAIKAAEGHLIRRAKRRHGGERRRRVLAANGHGKPAPEGRHLAR